MTPEQEAIEILMAFGKGGVTIADSGGKDSSALKERDHKDATDLILRGGAKRERS